MTKKKLVLNWSSGKDAAMALYQLQQSKSYEVVHLLTTVNAHYNRVTMHGLHRALLNDQIEALGIPFSTVELPEKADMPEYESIMKAAYSSLTKKDLKHAAFGDIFLEDLKHYREQQFDGMGWQTVFPLWKRNTTELLNEFLDLGFKAIVVCVKTDLLDQDFAGRVIDKSFIADLPETVDPCGENGEFHTFCFDGPVFKRPVPFSLGERSHQSYPNPDANSTAKEVGFCFQELLLNQQE